MPVHRLLIPFVALALAFAGCGGDGEGGDAAAPATPTPEPEEQVADLAGGATVLELDSALRTILDLAGVDIGAAGAAEAAGGQIRLPIEAGELDLADLAGRIEHAGGLSFRLGGRTITAEGLAIDAGGGRITAEVAGERLELFSLDFGTPRIPGPDAAPEVPAEVELAAGGAVDRINDALGADVLRGGLSVGELVLKGASP